jgi:ABC-type xylose transport system permease subunit
VKNIPNHYQDNQVAIQDIPFKRKFTLRYEITVILALAIIFVFFSILSPNFLGPLILPGILLIGAELGILALGQTFVIISGEIDLSIASVYLPFPSQSNHEWFHHRQKNDLLVIDRYKLR